MNFVPDTAEDQVNDLIFGRWKARVLYAGVSLGVFEALKSGARRSPEICRELGLDVANGYRLLRALASIGLLSEEPGEQESAAFALTNLGECLCSGHASNLRDVALLQDGPEHSAIWKHLPEMVREGWQNGFRREYGSGAFEYADRHPEYSRIFDAAMASYSAQQAAAAVQALRDFDFSGVEIVCDIGGGRGTLLRELLQAHPQLRGTVLERSAVIERIGDASSEAPGTHGWSYQQGDMFQEIPAADLYLLKLVLHDWADDQCARILENAASAAIHSGRCGARLLILEFVITAPDVPHFSKLYDIHMMCWGDGRERSLPQYERLLHRAGWEFTTFRALPSAEMGMIEARLQDR